MKKTIAIVGATETNGRNIAIQFASMPYRLLLVSDKPYEAGFLKTEILTTHPEAEIEALNCIKDGCWEADIIVLAVSSDEMNRVAEIIKEVATQKIVIKVTDEKNNDEELTKILPYSRLVSVSGFSSPGITISGNDKLVNEQIQQIFNLAGFPNNKEKFQFPNWADN